MARRKKVDVITAVREDLRAHLVSLREQIERLTREERAVAQALSSLDNDGTVAPSAARAPTGVGDAARRAPRHRSAAKGAATSRRPRNTKKTVERADELRGLLSDGPKSRDELAAALKVSPARVQQLLAGLGSSVSSQPDPERLRGKVWSLAPGGNAASAARATGREGLTQRRSASHGLPASRRRNRPDGPP